MLYLSWLVGLAAVVILCVIVEHFVKLWENF